MNIPPANIIAAFCNAQRLHADLSPAKFAARVGIRTDQIVAAEKCRRIAQKARAKLVEKLGLKEWWEGLHAGD